MRYKDLANINWPAEDILDVRTALTTLEQKLPRINLTPTDIKRMANMGQKNRSFVEAALQAGRNNPTLVPPGVDMVNVQLDETTWGQLLEVSQRLQQINVQMKNTRLALGADLYNAARAIYKSLQEFGRDAGLSELLAELGRRFKNRKKKDDTGTIPPVTTTGGTNA